MNLTRFLMALCMVSATLPDLSHAASVQPSEDPRCKFSLSGRIEKGDSERLLQLIGTGHQWDGNSICLDSPGGSYLEGRRLAEMFMVEGVATYVRRSDECQSACALAFLGGSVWGDFRHSSKTIEPGAIVAFNAPYFSTFKESYTGDEMSVIARMITDNISDLLSERDSLKISQEFLIKFILHNSIDTVPIETLLDAAHAGVNIAAKPRKVELVFDRMKSACKILFDREASTFSSPDTAWTPLFEMESSEFSTVRDLGEIKISGRKWLAVGTEHSPETTYLNASCAFSREPFEENVIEVLMWSGPSISDPSDADQLKRAEANWWYFYEDPAMRIDAIAGAE